MKQTKLIQFICLTLTIASVSFYSCADVKGVMSSTTDAVVKFGKDVVDGVGEGIDKGLGKDTKAKDQFVNYLVQVLNYKTEGGFTTVTVGVKEKNGKAGTIKDLNKNNIFLVDNNGYATELNKKQTTVDSVVLPKNAGRTFKLVFNEVASPKTLRLFGVELAITPVN